VWGGVGEFASVWEYDSFARVCTAVASAPPRHIALVCAGGRARMVPMQRLAEELVERGYRTTLIAAAGEDVWMEKPTRVAFVGLVAPAAAAGGGGGGGGAGAVLSGAYADVLRAQRGWAVASRRLASPLARALAADPPSLLVVDTRAPAGFAAADAGGTPALAFAPDLLLELDGTVSGVPAPYSAVDSAVRVLPCIMGRAQYNVPLCSPPPALVPR
jgi:hypothetical protein